MVDRSIDYPESAKNLASLFEGSISENLEAQALEILKTMNPKELAIYMADNTGCDKGLQLAHNYLKKQDESFQTRFKRYTREPQLLELSDEMEEGIMGSS